MSDPTQASGTAAIEAAAQALTDAKSGDNPPSSDQAQGDPDEALGEGGKKALKSEREARTAAERERDQLKRRLDEFEKAQMSDLERAQREAQEAKEAAAKAAAEAMRFRVASRFGISDEDADLFLTGSDEDTLTRQATRLKERTPTTPKPDPTQGAQNATALNGDGLTDALARAVGAR